VRELARAFTAEVISGNFGDSHHNLEIIPAYACSIR